MQPPRNPRGSARPRAQPSKRRREHRTWPSFRSPSSCNGCIPPTAGLSASDAAAILKTVGPNRIDTVKPKRLLADFIGRFSNPLVLILLFAAAVSAFTGDVPSFVIITVIVLMSVILDVTQEHQAENAAERLREQVSLSAKALRDGQPVDIPCGGDRAWRCRCFSRPAISCPPMPG